MDGKKKQERDIAPTIRMNGKSFFRLHYPVENSEWAETAIPYEDEKTDEDFLPSNDGDWQAQHFL